jgi:TetR/AcrR family transcriptional regulator, transcriptional repressor for nem operon
MKVTREQAAANRREVVEIASRAIRARGIDGASIAEIMKDAGLTHGGFYAAFGSKADLAKEAVQHALDTSKARWQAQLEQHDGDPLAVIAPRYLSAAHRDNTEGGCLYAALAADVARSGDRSLRYAFTRGLRSFIDRLTGGRSREQAILRTASLVGALILSRAVDDKALSEEILSATQSALGVRA